jgi:hypothetical protein
MSDHGEPGGGVTRRSVLVAVTILLVFAVAATYHEVVWEAGVVVAGAPAPWPLAVLLLLAAAMALPRFRKRGLTRRELLVVYMLVLVAAPLFGRAGLFFVLPKTIIYYHMARANPAWETTFLQHIPTWFAPTESWVRDGFFEGNAPVPWREWAVPAAVWFSFLLAYFGASFSAIILVQRQWITNERLAFPLAEIPQQLLSNSAKRASGDPVRSGRLTVNRIFWIGVLISFALNFLNGLARRFPALPTVPLGPVVIMPWLKVGPLAGLGAFYFTFWPWLVAIAYIIPREISFSCWFFWLVRMALHVVGIAAGGTPQLPEEVWGSEFPAPYYQATGAVLALGIWALWIARNHLARELRIAFSSLSGRADADEPMTYRWTVVIFFCCTAWLTGFLYLAGCRLLFALATVGLLVGLAVIWARIRAETALTASILDGYAIAMSPFGSAGLRPQEIVSSLTLRWATFPSPDGVFMVCAQNALESLKIADAAGVNTRRLSRATWVCFVIALAVGLPLLLAVIYHYGYFGTRAGSAPYWPSMQSRTDGGIIYNAIVSPSPTDTRGLAGILAGAAVCVLLGVARLRFWWWPFHPVGYIIGNSWGMHWYLVAFLVGWGAKILVIRYGGLRLYRKTIPLAMGLIMGDVMNTAVWSVVAFAAGGSVASSGG